MARLLATDLDRQFADKDHIFFPNIANDNIVKKIPMSIIIKGEFDNYLTPAMRFAEILKSFGRCLEFLVLVIIIILLFLKVNDKMWQLMIRRKLLRIFDLEY